MVHTKLLKEVSKDLDKLKAKGKAGDKTAQEAYHHAETLLKHGHAPLHKIANR